MDFCALSSALQVYHPFDTKMVRMLIIFGVWCSTSLRVNITYISEKHYIRYSVLCYYSARKG